MKDLLIGQYAKNNIQKAIDILNKEEVNIEQKAFVENIINYIGEPFLKNKLQEMYDNVFLDEIERKNKIQELEKEIEKLKNVDNSQE